MDERTSKIAIEYLEHYKKVKYGMMPEWVWDMAIKALDQEPILDKIRSEIEGLDANDEYWGYYDAIADVMEIIDEYKEESGEQGNE